MGIHCDIVVNPPADCYFVPGNKVTGNVTYRLDTKYTFKRIVISLKGVGRLTAIETMRPGKTGHSSTHHSNEDYVNIENIVQDGREPIELSTGEYTHAFDFQLPFNIPSTMSYEKKLQTLHVICTIKYYVRIKFETTSLLQFDKRFKEEINVVNKVIVPRLSVEPVTYNENKKLFQPFRSKNCIDIKATIAKSVIKPGEKVEVNCEINNETNVPIKSVTAGLNEVHSFVAQNRSNVDVTDTLVDTVAKFPSIKSGELKAINIIIDVPMCVFSSEYSRIISRDYFVFIKVELPTPHFDAFLKVPIQIGHTTLKGSECCPQRDPVIPEGVLDYAGVPDDAPPSYWEVMNT